MHCTLGIHPHLVGPDWQGRLMEMQRVLDRGVFVGIGEVGLDFTSSCKCVPACLSRKQCQEVKFQCQRHFLRAVFPLAEARGLPLILHCRDRQTGKAAEEVRQLLLELGLSHLPIHRHCFSGGVAEMRTWLDTFPRVLFGFTSPLLDDPATSQALATLSVDRVLLETDSPYLPSVRGQTNTPWQIESVARRVASILHLP